jgi:hypothetical protein
MNDLTATEQRVINELSRVVNGNVFLGDEVQDLIDLQGKPGTPVNAVAAAMDLTFDGVAIDGETVSIGADIYEFLADDAQSLTAPGNLAVDITGYVTGSVVTLTIDTQVTSGDTMTLEGKEYTFVPDGTANADGEVTIGTDLASGQAAIVEAINGTDGHNDAHPLVSCAAFGGNDAVITALIGGTAADAYESTSSFTTGSNQFSGVTFASGADCVQADAVTAVVVAVTAFDTEGVGAVDGAGDVVELTADVAGEAGNDITLAETCANGAFTGAATELDGGVDGTVGVAGTMQVDSSYIYMALDDNTIADANWVRVGIASF